LVIRRKGYEYLYSCCSREYKKRNLLKKYECQFEPTWGYDVSDVSAVNKILDDMIEEILLKDGVSYEY
jgi:hypothetical protein